MLRNSPFAAHRRCLAARSGAALEFGQVLATRKPVLGHRHRRFFRLGQLRNKPTRLLDVVHRAEEVVERITRIVARALDDGVRKEQAGVSIHAGHGSTARRELQ
jgi:hypothetical protein